MALFSNKDSSGNLECNFAYLSGISDFQYKTAVSVIQDNGHKKLKIKKRLSKEEPLFLDYSQIINCGVVKDLKIEKDGNNVISNAVVGGLILGPLGAIVGGLSGIGSKDITISKCFVINYHPVSNPDDTRAILLEVVGASLHYEQFVDSLKSKTNDILTLSQTRQL